MGYIDLDAGGNFRLVEATPEDLTGVRAGVRAHDGADQVTGELIFNAENPFNVAALWCAGVPWREAALQKAFEAIIPLAIQQISSFNPARFMRLNKCSRLPARPRRSLRRTPNPDASAARRNGPPDRQTRRFRPYHPFTN
ncbi:MAG: hypothetical protein GC161_11745 [Planctomycetaceae bacterium]|nr:hypothetical protein [Planctomycetaceae bacterium]